MAASSTILRTAVQPIPTRPPGSNRRPTNFSGASWQASSGCFSRKRCGPRPRTNTTTCTPTSNDLENVIDMAAIRDSKIALGVDPLGGAGIDYWPLIAERYGLNLTVVNESVDPTFRFMTVDWDGKIRMDPSSPYAMQRLIGLKDKFDIAFACDTDHDRHGIVTKGQRLAAAEPLSFGVHSLLVLEPEQMGPGRRRRENGGEQQHDRSRYRAAGAPAVRGARSDSNGLSKVCWPDGWASAAKKAPGSRFSAATPACGPPTKTESSLACSRRKSPREWEKIRAKSTANSRGTWATRFTSASTLPPRRNKKPRWRSCRQPTSTSPKLQAKKSSRFSPQPPETTTRSAESR